MAPIPTHEFFAGLVHSDFRGYECGPGHANDTSASLNNWPWGNLLDAGRGTAGNGVRAGGPRVFIDTNVNPALGFPNNRAVHLWVRQDDGNFAINGLTTMDTSQCEWDENRSSVYTSGPYNGQSRSEFLPADAPANGATSWGTPQEVYYGMCMAFPSPMYSNPNGCLVGFEDHDASGGVQPWWSFDVWNGKWSFVIRGGPKTQFRNHYFLFDDNGFYMPLIGPHGGGTGTWYDMRNGTAQGSASSPAGALFQSRQNISQDTRYDIVIRIITSDREWDGGSPPFSIPPYTGAPWTPMAATAGEIQMWMKKQSEGSFREIIPTTKLATAYSDDTTPRKALGSYKKLIIYRSRSGNTGDFHYLVGEHRRGASFAAVDPTQDISGGPPPPPPPPPIEDPTPPTNYIGRPVTGSSFGLSSPDANSGSNFVAPVSGTIDRLFIRRRGAGTAGQTNKIKPAVYAVTGTMPGALLMGGPEVTRAGNFADEWTEMMLTSPLSVVAGTTYALHKHDGGDVGAYVFTDNGLQEFHYMSDTYTDGTANPFVNAEESDRRMSIYAPITVAAGTPSRPISDVSSGGWTPSVPGSLFATLDEAAASDADFIQSPFSPSVPAVSEVKLTNRPDPGSSTGHIVRYRFKKNITGGDWLNLTVRLMQGSRMIASWSHVNISATASTAAQTLSAGQADAITNYNDLRLRFEVETVDTSNEINVLTQHGTSDAQVRAAISAADSQGKNLYFPAATYQFSTTVITNNGKRWRGDGDTTIIQANTPAAAAIRVIGDGAVIRDMKLTCPTGAAPQALPNPGRLSNGESNRIFIDGLTVQNWRIKNVTIDKGSGAAILNYGGHDGLIEDCRITNTAADGIHMTRRAFNVEIRYCYVNNVGDDFFAVASQTSDGGRSHDITVHDCVGYVQPWGRGMTCIASYNVRYFNMTTHTTYGAGLYVASEDPPWSDAVDDVVCDNNVIRNPSVTIHNANMFVWAKTSSVRRVSGSGNITQSGKEILTVLVEGTGSVQDISLTGAHG